jgi:carbamoyl-phosphate synthase large subunit
MASKHILILPGTTLIAKEIHDSLLFTKNVEIFGAGIEHPQNSKADFKYKDYLQIGRLDSKDFQKSLDQIIRHFRIDYIFLAHDEWILAFRNQDFISGAIVIRHPSHTIEITSFKSRTYEKLDHLSITPITYSSFSEVLSFPCVIKPNRGQGSKGFQIVLNEDVAAELVLSGTILNEYVICEYLPGEEFTIDCFSNSHGDLIYASPRKRSKIESGLSTKTSIVESDSLVRIATTLNLEFDFRGPWFFQVKLDKSGEPKLLEVACRVAGASGIQRFLGVNFSELWLYQISGTPVKILNNILSPVRYIEKKSTVHLSEKFSAVYVDFDDCLYIKNRINEPLLDFIVSSKKIGLEIHLISRHKGNLGQLLFDLKIQMVFTRVIHILDNSKKSDYILPTNKILFIDDSFSERFDFSQFDNVVTVDPSVFLDQIIFDSIF